MKFAQYWISQDVRKNVPDCALSTFTIFITYCYSVGIGKLVQSRYKKMWKIKFQVMKCGNIKCDRIRKDVNKMYKCKGCCLVRYCSKRCQKIDWNAYNHKTCCKQLSEMQ